MDDVISLSSGSEEDSDIEFVSSYRDDSSSTFPFITAELLPVTPVLIDITDHRLSSDGSRPSQRLKKLPCSTIEIIDLNDVSESRNGFPGKSRRKVHESYTGNYENDVICLDSGDGNAGLSSVPVSCDQGNLCTNQRDGVQSCLRHEDGSTRRSVSAFHHSVTKDITDTTNTNTQQTPTSQDSDTYDENEVEPANSWLCKTLSPFSLDSLDSLDSSYYCPSDIDPAVFSDGSLILYDDDNTQPASEVAGSNGKANTHTSSPYPQTQSQLAPQVLPTSDQGPLPLSPTSTELLAGDSPESGSDLDMESPPISPVKSSYPVSPPSELVLGIKDSASVLQVSGTDSDSDDISESQTGEGQQISLVQFKKLKYLLGGQPQDMHTIDEDNKDFGTAEPLCRQSLSLVYSTIDENYTEGTLQLLSDLIQPCYYPPADITAHLLKGILLEPQSTPVLALEAYNLLMRTQKYHPADIKAIVWDWELLSSMMAEQDKARRLHTEVRCLLLQYVLQVLEDDFQFKLPTKRLHLSIAREMLSCDNRFMQVRELITWLLDTAKQSLCTSEDEEKQKREQNCCLKMLLILQRMLLLAMEVDLRPTCISSKLSRELCNSLNSTAPCRRLRFLLLSTLQSNLLRCKMVELLLDQSCSQKRELPMSFKLLLHFLHTSTLAPDPSDGAERWRRWDELLQLVWMLMLSYKEVIAGHLRYSITERFKLTRAPMWTQNDKVSRAAVREAAEAFLSRAVKDLGHDLPSQIQESLSQLQEHLLSISLQ